MNTVAIIFIFVAIAAISYLLGSVNPSIVISKVFMKKDIRTLGSGNAGLTNMYRNFGAVPALFALILDPGKAVLSVYLGKLLSTVCGLDPIIGAYVAAVFVVLGHLYPIYFKFKGGKGVLAMAGAIILIHPYMLLIGLGIFAAATIFTKYVSLGSILSCGTLFIQIIIWAAIENAFVGMFWFELIFSTLLSGLIIFTHRGNIKRIFNGTERKITDKKKKSTADTEKLPENIESKTEENNSVTNVESDNEKQTEKTEENANK